MELVLETQHVAREEEGEAGHSYLLSEPMREPVSDTIFDGMGWPEIKGPLFKFCQREYGRCASKVYIDRGTDSRPIGWVFERQEAFEDVPDKSFTREVWVTLLTPVACDQRQPHLRPINLNTGELAT